MNIHSLEEYTFIIHLWKHQIVFSELVIIYSHHTRSLVYETYNYLY